MSLLLFYLSHGGIKISYNILARKTSRNQSLKRVIDGFTGLIGLWTLSNVIVVAVALAQRRSPSVSVKGATHGSENVGADQFSVASVLLGLRNYLNSNNSWSTGRVSLDHLEDQSQHDGEDSVVDINGRVCTVSRHTLKPKFNAETKSLRLCMAAIIVRLAFTPSNYFGADWTFDDVFQAMIFLIELNLVTITVLAPNLPVFFKKTSTGGVYFLPGEAVGGSKNGTQLSSHKGSKNTYALSNVVPWSTSRSEAGVYTNEADRNVTFTTSQRGDDKHAKKASFDSDRILIRTSIEVERSLERQESESHQSGEV